MMYPKLEVQINSELMQYDIQIIPPLWFGPLLRAQSRTAADRLIRKLI